LSIGGGSALSTGHRLIRGDEQLKFRLHALPPNRQAPCCETNLSLPTTHYYRLKWLIQHHMSTYTNMDTMRLKHLHVFCGR